jgi:uncharacterized protein (TIGR00296 family)
MKTKLYSRTVCYYTSLQRKYIDLYNFTPFQLTKTFDILNESSQSISYAGIVFTSQPYIQLHKHRKIDSMLSQFEKLSLLNMAREKLYIELFKKSPINYIHIPSNLISPLYSQSYKLNLGIFTTIYKNNVELRGCIGTTDTDDIETTIESNISKFIVESAFNDSRFNHLDISEYNNIELSITILYKLKPISVNDYYSDKFIMGKDGILLKQDNRSGYILPSIIKELKYTKQELLEQLFINNLGLSGIEFCLKDNTELYYNEGFEFNEKEL